MKIYKDILNALRIEATYVLTNETTYMCIPLEIKNNTWVIACDSNYISGKVILKVKFNGSNIYLNTKIKKQEQDAYNSFIYEIEIDEEEKKKDNFKYVFFTMIYEMEEKCSEWNKRSEERYEIGLDEQRLNAISFKSPEQIIVIEKLQLPCVVNNISYNGAKITTMEASFQKEKKVCLYLSFTKPIEQIPMIATVRNCFLKTTKENVNMSIVSMQYDEPSYEYKQRIHDFIKKMQGEKTNAQTNL